MQKCVCGLVGLIPWACSVTTNMQLWQPTFPHHAVTVGSRRRRRAAEPFKLDQNPTVGWKIPELSPDRLLYT